MSSAWLRRTCVGVGVVVVGVLLGTLGRASDYMAAPAELALTLGMPWLSVSFAAGWCARERWEGALAGATVLVVAVAAYYALKLGVEGRAGPRYAAAMVVLWGGFGALTGAVFGFAGAVLRSGAPLAQAGALSLLAGALIGEGLLYLLAGRGEGMSGALLLGELSAGLLLPLLFSRRRQVFRATLALTGLAAFIAIAADAAIRIFARLHGWGG